MGCSAAKNVTVDQIDLKASNSVDVTNTSNNHLRTGHKTIISPTEAEDTPQEVLDKTSVNNLQKGANGLAFEIKFSENENEKDSIIQKHPPKRILELQEPQSSPPTLKKLQNKLEEAEIRRQQILQQRVQSAGLRKSLKNQGSGSFSSDNFREQSPHHLKVPSEEKLLLPNYNHVPDD